MEPQETPWYETASLPALLRHARTPYGTAMREALEAAGYDDLPANGLYVIGALAYGKPDAQLAEIIADLRMSKQAAGQLIDTLVTRGYLTRAVDAADRRKLTITLTERGHAAALAQSEGRAKIDAALTARIGDKGVLHLRKALAALASLGHAEATATEQA